VVVQVVRPGVRPGSGQAFLVVIVGLQEAQVAAAQGAGLVAGQVLHRRR
jgi:hypothetical protein